MFRRKKRFSDHQLPLKKQSNSALQKQSGNTALATPEDDQHRSQSLAVNPVTPFEQPVVLRQSPFWSRFIFWTIFVIVCSAVGYAFIAEIEQVVPATGQLKPQDTVKSVQAPVDGVVDTVYVEDGDTVAPGDLLMRFDTTSERADLQSALAVKESLQQENQFYRGLIESGNTAEIRKAIASLDLPPSVVMLTKNREELKAENRFYLAQLGGNQQGLTPQQQARLRTAEVESESRESTAKLAISQTKQELQQNKVQLIDARNNLETDRQILSNLQQRARNSIQQARESLQIEQNILNDMTPLAKEGAIPNYQYQKQQQTVSDRIAQLRELEDNARIEIREQQQQIETRQAEIARLQEEQRRLQLEMSQGGQELVNTTATTQKEIQEAIARNEQRIADIDSQLVQAILNILVENEKRIKELNSRISQLQQRLQYQEVRAKVAGKVFDLQAYNGFVANPSEKLLDIVPQDQLVAEVFITNKDIGFVQEGMDADVRIDTFPFSEFGDIDGTVKSIGSDALPPDENNQVYRFPAKVTLDQQALVPKGGRRIPLQSGMSVTVNIKVRENRKVISLFIELFTDQVESLKQVR